MLDDADNELEHDANLEPVPEHQLDDDDLANLLAKYHEDEDVDRTANLIAAFYTKLRERIDPLMTSAGEVHDPALELTREWMTYTIGGDE